MIDLQYFFMSNGINYIQVYVCTARVISCGFIISFLRFDFFLRAWTILSIELNSSVILSERLICEFVRIHDVYVRWSVGLTGCSSRYVTILGL